MANKYLDYVANIMKPKRNSTAGSRYSAMIGGDGTTGGSSGSWEEDKKPIPSVDSLLAPAKKAEAAGKDIVDKGRANTAGAMAVAQQRTYGATPETSKIDAVTDRYQSYYDDSRKALGKFNQEAFGESGNTGYGDSESMAAYNSPQRGQLMMQQRQAYRLLKEGSFADNANLKTESRQKDLALAKGALADIPYQQSMGNAALQNAATSSSAEQRKNRESLVAEEYLTGKKKKTQKGAFDLNELNALFPN